jgi:hypothetical protein
MTDTSAPALDLSPFTVDALARFALNDPTLTGNARTFARPYLEALTACETLADNYGADSARMLAAYAVSNLGAWRGDSARAWKAEMNARLRKVTR